MARVRGTGYSVVCVKTRRGVDEWLSGLAGRLGVDRSRLVRCLVYLALRDRGVEAPWLLLLGDESSCRRVEEGLRAVEPPGPPDTWRRLGPVIEIDV